MDILILDIGCSNTKGFVYRSSGSSVSLLWKKIVPTPATTKDILATCQDMVNSVLYEGYYLSGVLTTSFSDSVMAETEAGKLVLHAPLDACGDGPREIPPYMNTGYSSLFPTLRCRLNSLENKYGPLRRALPVSGFVSAFLCGNTNWKKWDWTHASNTGMWAQTKQEWVGLEERFSDLIPADTVSPGTIVGQMGTVSVLIGGHDTLFIPANTSCAYVSTGTWTTASVPQLKFCPDVREKKRVRWLRDPSQTLHKQILIQTPSVLSEHLFNHVAGFLGKPSEINVVGSFAHRMESELRLRGWTPRVREHKQHEEAAKFAVRQLQ